MSIDIYAADEQHRVPNRPRTLGRARQRRAVDEGVRGLREVSLIFADEITIASLNQQFMGNRVRRTS